LERERRKEQQTNSYSLVFVYIWWESDVLVKLKCLRLSFL
jgi:hypothetical protein